MSFEVQLNKRAKRDLQGLAPGVQAKVISGLREFRTNPFAGDHKKLRGVRDGHRRRIGDYRIIYTVDSKTRLVLVVGIKDRKDAYRS